MMLMKNSPFSIEDRRYFLSKQFLPVQKIIDFHDIIRMTAFMKKKLQKKIGSLRAQIEEHKEKIRLEKQKSFPNEGCITHWEKEITAFEQQIEKAVRRLEGK